MDEEKKEKLLKVVNILVNDSFPGSTGAMVIVLQPDGSMGCAAIKLSSGIMAYNVFLSIAALLKCLESEPKFRTVLRKALDTPNPDVLALLADAYKCVEDSEGHDGYFQEL